MTKVYCDICGQERTVCKREVVTSLSIGGYPHTTEMDTCDECNERILQAQVDEYRKIQKEATTTCE